MKHLILLLSVFVLAFHNNRGDHAAAPAPGAENKPLNVILMIGDGMGMAQVTAGLYANGGRLNLEQFPITGLMKTHSAKNLITDSAAGATAFSCGCKTYNGAIGMTAAKKPCPTILEQAEALGLATGLVATSSLTHATPASFIGHATDRQFAEEIATYFLKTNIDLAIGGGMKYFNHRKTDTRDLYAELQTKGYTMSNFAEKTFEQAMLSLSPEQPFFWFASNEEPASVEEGRNYLPIAARMAPTFLSQRSDKGFFLMIEGSQIDWACHANKGDKAVQEMIDFDEAIGEVLKFAEKDGNTLVIVTADHETGGLALLRGEDKESLSLKFTTDYHTASLVPVFAYGPGAELFSGLIDNTDIYVKMRELLRFPAIEAK
ncbi:MAG: alkaline phosphatase [Saprospiraceae bacterium]|nr:alkaline phosphatase [Saprospiraceae bacterium]